MTEKNSDNNIPIVIGDVSHLPETRSKMISRGLEIAESLERIVFTIIRDIFVSIDKNGYLNKWAIIDTVKIEGEQISQVNLGYLFNKKNLLPERTAGSDFRIGDTIAIESIGGFTFKKVVKEKRTGNEKTFTLPVKCPVCGSKIETDQPDSAYYCTRNSCPGRIKAQIIAFSDSLHIDIDPEIAQELVDKRIISDSADLYFLKKKDLMQLNKMDEGTSKKILDAIEKSRHPDPKDIVIALLEVGGIPSHVAFEIAFKCNSINDLFDGNLISQIKPNKYRGVRQDHIIAIQKIVNEKRTIKFLEKLKRGGVTFSRKGGD